MLFKHKRGFLRFLIQPLHELLGHPDTVVQLQENVADIRVDELHAFLQVGQTGDHVSELLFGQVQVSSRSEKVVHFLFVVTEEQLGLVFGDPVMQLPPDDQKLLPEGGHGFFQLLHTGICRLAGEHNHMNICLRGIKEYMVARGTQRPRPERGAEAGARTVKIIAIGDLHGKNCWKQATRKDGLYVFIGDYVDSFTHSNTEILNNLNAIIAFKKSRPQNVVLLLGNHDIQYLYYPKYRCSGFRPDMQKELTGLFRAHEHLFQIAYQKGDVLFTHAGISNRWFADFRKQLHSWNIRQRSTLADTLNFINMTDKRDILHTAGLVRGGDSLGGITWADASETRTDFLEGYHQVVGHTKVPYIVKQERRESSITYIDCLDSMTEFLEIV